MREFDAVVVIRADYRQHLGRSRIVGWLEVAGDEARTEVLGEPALIDWGACLILWMA